MGGITRALFEAVRLQIHYDQATNRATCRITLTAETIAAAANAAGEASSHSHANPERTTPT